MSRPRKPCTWAIYQRLTFSVRSELDCVRCGWRLCRASRARSDRMQLSSACPNCWQYWNVYSREILVLIVDAHEDIAYNVVTFGRDYTRSAQETRAAEAD